MPSQLHQFHINEFIAAAETCLGEDLISLYLFGSAAQDQLRTQSDVNMLVVLKQFCALTHTPLQPALRQARAAIQLHVMFIEQAELQSTADCFTAKFADIKARHRLMRGTDSLVGIDIKLPNLAQSARQMVINFQLRSREQFLIAHSREEQLIKLIASAAAPLRASAAALMAVRSGNWQANTSDGKQALKQLTDHNPSWSAAVQGLSAARETQTLPEGCAKNYFNALQEIARFLSAELKCVETNNVSI